MRLKLLFVILFIASNLMILPLYYHSEKQDFKGMVSYLKANLRDGDKIFVTDLAIFRGYFIILGYIQKAGIISFHFGKRGEMNMENPLFIKTKIYHLSFQYLLYSICC